MRNKYAGINVELKYSAMRYMENTMKYIDFLGNMRNHYYLPLRNLFDIRRELVGSAVTLQLLQRCLLDMGRVAYHATR